MIDTIIVMLKDKEVSTVEFKSLDDFINSDVYKTNLIKDAEIVSEPVKAEVPAEPAVVESTIDPVQ